MYLCFDIGGTNIKAAVVDSAGKIHTKISDKTKITSGVGGIIRQLQENAKYLLKKVKIKDIEGIAVGVPGFVQEDGVVLKAPNLGWEKIQLRKLLNEAFSSSVYILNDANAAALGEMYHGAGKNKRNLLCITLGTGVGGGVIVNGEIVHGNFGMAGEVGHFQVELRWGRPCSCGKHGCLETESSASALEYYAELAVAEGKDTLLTEIKERRGKITGEDVAIAAARKDHVALKIMERATYYLGYALANIFLINAPDLIIIGGGVAAAGEVLFEPLYAWFDHFIYDHIESRKVIVPAQLGNDAGLIGLANFAHEQLLEV